MAKESSFDVVSEVDFQEVDNAFQQARKELTQRYDLKDSGASVAYEKAGHTFTITAPSTMVAGQLKDLLITKFVKRGVDARALSFSDPEAASGGQVRLHAEVVAGIDDDLIKKINKDIKAQKFKAKTQIEGDKIRVASASRDELQQVIGFLRESDYGIPLQFTNYR